ncbi:MAG: hypothetical protein GWO04_31095, partial [Actinobacteria bacterium]|nr:hypothetical protein [Actinomycetota bacterium]
ASIDCERCTFLDNEGAGFWIGTSFVDTTRGRVSNSYFRNHLVGIGALSTDAQLEVETVLVEGASLGMLAWGAVVDGADIYLHDGIQRPGAPAAS